MDAGFGADQAMNDNLLIEELKLLENGILLEITKPCGEKQAVFFQARANYLHLDTPAFVKVDHCSINSFNGCPACQKVKTS